MSRAQRAQANAAFVKVTYLRRRRISAPEDPNSARIYAVKDRRYSGEWRTVGEYSDPAQANAAADQLRAAGANDVRIELVEQPVTV